jgi:hypothetical protein
VVPAIAEETPDKGEASAASGKLWHERLAHVSLGKLEALQRRGLLPRMKNAPERKGECRGCALGKAVATSREKAAEDRLHNQVVKHPAAKGCTDDGTLAIVPIYIPNLD